MLSASLPRKRVVAAIDKAMTAGLAAYEVSEGLDKKNYASALDQLKSMDMLCRASDAKEVIVSAHAFGLIAKHWK